MNLSQLRQHLCQPGLRQRVGLWLVPADRLDREIEEAARVGVETVDLRRQLLDRLPSGTRFTGLSKPDGWQRLAHLIQQVGQQGYTTDVVLVLQADLLIAGLAFDQRSLFWEELYRGLPYLQTAMILALPQDADTLSPPQPALQKWASDARLAADQQ